MIKISIKQNVDSSKNINKIGKTRTKKKERLYRPPILKIKQGVLPQTLKPINYNDKKNFTQINMTI